MPGLWNKTVDFTIANTTVEDYNYKIGNKEEKIKPVTITFEHYKRVS